MGAGDSILPPRSWNLSTRKAFGLSLRPHDKDILVPLPEDTFLTPRFHIYLNGTDATRLRITTKQGSFDLSLADIAPAGEKTYLDGRAKVQDSAFPILVGRATPAAPPSASPITTSPRSLPSPTAQPGSPGRALTARATASTLSGSPPAGWLPSRRARTR
ncbi:MAG: hypothetical protein R2748_02635 [Bryobacterales bacterium]